MEEQYTAPSSNAQSREGVPDQVNDALIPDNFFDRLEQTYIEVLGDAIGPALWAYEGTALQATIGNIARQISTHYRLRKPLSMGGAGIVILVENLSLSSSDFSDGETEPKYSVLKMPRPVAGQVEILNHILYGETKKLLQLNHQNLVRIEYVDREVGGTYFYVMQFLSNLEDADEAIARQPTLNKLMQILRGAFLGIEYLHKSGIAHLDIKPGNVFSTDSQSVVGDLGFAKAVDVPGVTTNIGGTRGYQHQDHLSLIHEASISKLDLTDSNRLMNMSEVYREKIHKEWDIYSLGITVLVLLRILSSTNPASVQTYEYRYLTLMAYRMLGEKVDYAAQSTDDIRKKYSAYEDEPIVRPSYLGIPASAFVGIAYHSLQEIVADFLKLTGESDITKEVPELAEFQTETIQASSLVAVPFSPRLRALIDTDEVAGLTDVDQLGLVRLIYPVASHSRLEHVLGTAALATKYARALLADQLNPIFRQLISRQHVEALLLAALVHDIGHYALAHDLEEVDPEIFHHEVRTKHLLTRDGSAVREAINSGAWRANLDDVLQVLKEDDETGAGSSLPLQTQVLQSILDGPIDADKVDYLVRDSENLRLPYGRGIDVEKLISTLTVVVSSDTRGVEARVGIHEKGRIPAESVAFARYSMFGSVYWHKTHRALKAMLNRIGMEALWRVKQAHQSTYRDALRTELYELLGEASDELFSLSESRGEKRVSSSRLDPMSQQIVLWLASKVPPSDIGASDVDEFRELAVRLLERKHYKRVLVISRVRPENQNRPWGRIDQLFGNTKDTWEARRRAALGLQARIATVAEKWIGTAPESAGHAMRALASEFVRRNAAGAPLVLLDSPPAGRVGSRRPLEILHEPYWIADARAELSVSAIEDSSVWTALAKSYPESLGKLRVFCHPDFQGLVAALSTREDLEQMVWDAVTRDARL